MRSLTKTKNDLRKVLRLFTFKATGIEIPGTVAGRPNVPGTHFTDVQNMRSIISILEENNLFPKEVAEMKRGDIFKYDVDSINVGNGVAGQISSTFYRIQEIVSELLNMLESTVPDENEASINVLLPSNITDLGELSHFTRELHLAISQVVINEEIGGREEIQRVENGSIWLNIYLGTAAATSLIGSIVWAAIVILKKKKELELLGKQLEALNIQIANNQNLSDINKKQIDLLSDAEAQLILSEYFKDKPQEVLERLKNSIRTFSEIIDKGAEIHPSITAPEQVANLFPNVKNLLGIESRTQQKLLDNKK